MAQSGSIPLHVLATKEKTLQSYFFMLLVNAVRLPNEKANVSSVHQKKGEKKKNERPSVKFNMR